jgi:TusA-related sulfurtransferase
MKGGQTLAVLTDHAPSIESIQEGAANLGYRVLTIEKMDTKVFSLYVEKPHMGEET